jgi:hypothetical protein
MTSLLNIAGNIPVSAAVGGQSLRFEDGDNPYLQWTPSTNGSSLTQTLSFWIKRTTAGNYIFRASEFYLYLDGNNLNYYDLRQGANGLILKTNAVYRDVSAWMHVVLTQDRGNATASNRIKLYVNGEQITSFSTATYPNQSEGSYFNNSGNTHYISHPSTNQYDGYLANVTFIDGTALDPTSFGEYEDTLWKPKSDTDIQALTFGTNGFYLPFKQTTEAEGFSTVTYTGNGGTQGIEGVGFEPDIVWIKSRSFSNNHHLFDSVRGAGKILRPSSTDAESTLNVLSSFDSGGFTVAETGGNNATNDAGSSFVAWCWDAGSGSAVSNTDGSITSSVKANTTNGFSIVSYTGNGINGSTIGHGLSSAPEMMIIRNRDRTANWRVYTDTTGNTGGMDLDSSGGFYTATNMFNSTSPAASVFTVGTSSNTNQSGEDFIAYMFHSVSGYSSIGSFTGSGSAGNSITGLGFKPAFMMIKRTDAADSWMLFDNTRDPVNPAEKYLFADAADSEATFSSVKVDFDSDGFTLQGGANSINNSSGTYIYMAFKDTRDATFFGDTSGNGNNWTPNALNNTDVVPDSPVSGGNFAVFNSLSGGNFYGTAGSYSEGNLHMRATNSVSSHIGADSTIAVSSGKWYWEIRAGSNGSSFYPAIGVRSVSGTATNDIVHYRTQTQAYINGTPSGQTLSTYTSGDVIGLGLDLDNDTLQFYKNGSANGSTYSLNSGYEWVSLTGNRYNSSTSANFGADSSFFGQETPQGNTDDNGVGDFQYAPPSGFLALTTGNLPLPAITAPDEYFNTLLYTGTGSSLSVTGANFQPDWTWIKKRSGAENHALYDAVRGATNRLQSNVTTAENTGGLTSFDSDGFTVDGLYGTDGENGATYAAWNWLAGNGTVSNTSGSITSTVSANQTAGFSVVSYVGNLTAGATVGHGLLATPEMIIIKNRGGTQEWIIYHASKTSTGDLRFDSTAGTSSDKVTGTSSSTFTVAADNAVNSSSGNHIAYCFHSVESYSKCGVYTGNGSTDGTFVHCGFRPAWVLIKSTGSSSNGWYIYDNKRENYGTLVDAMIYANLNNAEDNGSRDLDFISNGFKPRLTDTNVNGSGSTYIFLAFAEAPFKNANAR